MEVAQWSRRHGELSGFYPLRQGMNALGVRMQLAEEAEKSIDLQYFLMKNDTAGAVITNALLRAADRGARVRFLLDDIFTSAPDGHLLLMNQHPNIEVRIFNPLSRRGLRLANFIGDFQQANRRMHNKSFTVDNAFSVVGGRNIADEYFQLRNDSVFADLDVLAMGPIVHDISLSFDEYWNHSRTLPINSFATNRHREDLQAVRAKIAGELDNVYQTVFAQALTSRLLQDLITGRRPLYAAPAKILVDSPDKLINPIHTDHMQVINELGSVMRLARREIILVSPYLVPGKDGMVFFRELLERDIRLVMLTNSLASNNHIAVHSGYARYRRDMIRAGVELYEVRANAARELQPDGEDPEILTLHTKAFIIDRRYLFVGSLNLDPRSIEINAEMGLLIDSANLVEDLIEDVDRRLAKIAYRVVENAQGELEWHGVVAGQKVVKTKEPLSGFWRRWKAWFMKIVPERQL